MTKPRPKRASLNREHLLSSRTVYTGPVFSVRRDRLIEPGGIRVTRDVVVHPGSVVILPVLPGGRILLVRQYRHSAARFLWELTAGRIEPGESPASAARRELAEETGYTARHFRQLLDLFPSPGFVNEHMVIFAAEGLAPGIARPESDERISLGRFSISRLLGWIHHGRLRDAKSVAAILFYARFRDAI
jgi:ADP-ribose diphosphatase